MTTPTPATPTTTLPGRPGELLTAATTLEQAGAVLTETGAAMRRITSEGWQGAAAEAFRRTFGGEPVRWEQAGDAFAAAGRALASYAEAMLAGQVATEEADIRTARADAQTAEARAAYERAELTRRAEHEAQEAAGFDMPAFVPGPFADPGGPERAEAERARKAARAAVRDAGDLAAAAVRAACEHAPEKPRWWERALDALSGAFGFGDHPTDRQFGVPYVLVGDPALLRARLDQLRAAGVPPRQYENLLRSYWYSVAGRNAGVDLEGWDPAKGAGALRGTIEDVYSYYGRMYVENPHLQWAGMANMIGPSFAGGFFDLDAIGEIADRVAGPLDELPDAVKPLLPTGLREISALSDLSQSEIAFYERTFLGMQKEIFIDQAVMHEAYLAGGLPAIAELGAAGVINGETVQAWSDIETGRATGDADLLARGNTELLRREQEDVIADNYNRMYDHRPTGPAFTYLMSAVGEPSIPGAVGLAEFAPLDFTTPGEVGWGPIEVPVPAQITVSTPLPDGNLAHFDDRWALVTGDTLPAYQNLLRIDPDGAAALVGSDVHDRIEADRLRHHVDDIATRLTTGWDVAVR